MKICKRIFLLAFISLSVFLPASGICQPSYTIHPAPSGILHPATPNVSDLLFPWAGGLNSCQFCALDLNQDGIGDLLIFDRHGNRKLTFINHGMPGSMDYTYAPQYAGKLPPLHDWVITADFNCDGKMDLFTYGFGGVRVFQNISDTTLKFKLLTDLLESYYYTGKVGILVTSVDYPALADIDGDGDLDLLTFFGLGSYVEYHKNLSVEKYGNCDSLDFRLSDHCWGKFKESEGGNHIQLNAICPYSSEQNPFPWQDGKGPKHTGSTMLATDLNNDGLKDLIIGDVDFPGLIALTNGGSTDTAFMVAQDTAFPSGSRPVHLFSFPAANLLDLDNDGIRDLVISPFDPNLFISDNFNSTWFYKNTGTNEQPVFQFQTDRLFRSEMMDFGSSSFPVLYDFDGDGLTDLFVGNFGFYDSSYYFQGVLHSVYTSKIAYFKNKGTHSSPLFEYITDDLAGISQLHLQGAYPAFTDLTGDGFTDLLIGNADGTLIFFPNSGGSGDLPTFGEAQRNYQQINSGTFSAPQLFDLNNDGLPDLIIGERSGNLNYYENRGTSQNPLFTFVTDSLGKINVTNYHLSYDGFSTPWFFRLPQGNTRLLVGSDEGRLYLFDSIDGNLSGKFASSVNLYQLTGAAPPDTSFGWRTSCALALLSDPGKLDLIVGNFSGGLNYISAKPPARIIPGIAHAGMADENGFLIFPNPADKEAVVESTYQHQAMDSNGSALHPLSPVSPLSSAGSSALILSILDLFGRTLLKTPFADHMNLNTARLPDGIYLVRIGSTSRKLVIRHP
ncbi:MAG: T9SS type A sorting domain-containing protein [Bacteroidota bacterium]